MSEMQQGVVTLWHRLGNINLGCHGIPERCLNIRGKRMTICARCFGSTIGHIISIILFLLGRLPSIYIASMLIVIMLTDWSLQAFMKIPSTNFRRVITGFIGGLGIGTIIWTVVEVISHCVHFW